MEKVVMRILIGFLTAHHASRAVHVTAQREWMKNSPIDYKFVYGTAASNNMPNREPLPDELFFDVNDTKAYLVLKNKALFKWALEQGYDYVFRACDDSVVYPERLLQHVELLAQHDYAGTFCGYGKLPGYGIFALRYLDYCHGGVGIWLSRKAMAMLLADDWKGPFSSPLTRYVELTPDGEPFKGSWHIYWDDLWIGEVLKGNLNYSDPRRNAIYQNYLVHVLDAPALFASNKPFDEGRIIARHSLEQMGTSNIKPEAFSTRLSTIQYLKVDWKTATSDFHAIKATGVTDGK
jgi:hypothetical protein